MATRGVARPPLPPQTRTGHTVPRGMLHPGLCGRGGASSRAATSPCCIPHLSWAAGSTISVILLVLPYLANSDPVFPGVSFLMELEIIWALLFACVLAGGGYGWRQRRGAARAPSATSAHPTAPQTHPRCAQHLNPAPGSSYIHSSMYSYFFFSKKKGSDPSNAPFEHPKGGERWEAGGWQGKRGASQCSDGKCSREEKLGEKQQ